MSKISLILILLLSTTIKADNHKYASIHQLAADSNLVIIGTISVVSPYTITIGADEIIQSDLTIPITETLKGSTSSPVTVTVNGGTVSGITMVSSAYPRMAVGMRGVWFLSTATMGKRSLIGGGQGLKLLNTDDTVYNERGLTLALIRLQIM